MDVFSAVHAGLPEIFSEREFSFSKHTTIGCGGTAEAALSPVSAEQLFQAISFLRREGIAYCFLGAGANVLPAEGRFQGVVIRFHRLDSLFCCGTRLYVGGGAGLCALLSLAQENELGGFEPLIGIPATAGGATAMNAGIPVRHMGDLVEKVVAVGEDGIRILNNRECDFAEKDSVFLRGIAVAGVVLRGVRSRREKISQELCFYRSKRTVLPKGKSMGCVFVNPEGLSAGRLIDECGLKGRRRGGAFVSFEHANFIINDGGTAGEIAQLISDVKEEVLKQTGIALREEIRRLP